MKIILIMPPTETNLSTTSPDSYKKLDVGYYPPLGLMYLASYLKKYSDHKVEILDMILERTTLAEIKTLLITKKPDAVGIYTTSLTVNNVYKLTATIKEIDRNIKVIIGGPHVDIYPVETISWNTVDFVVIEEGEITLTLLLNTLEEKKDISEIEGIYFKENGAIKFTGKRPYTNIDELPFPTRHLTQYKKYYSAIGKNKIATTLMTSRGCPYRCNFCFIQHEGRYKMRQVENVISEIKECMNLGINEFLFFDEMFTINKKRVLEICDNIINQKLNIVFAIRSRVNTVDREILLRLKKAGCMRIQYGAENASDEILKAMNKKITVEQIRKAVKETKEVGIEVFLDFIIGYPGETKEQIMKTINFAIELDPDYVQFCIAIMLPKTKIYNDALESEFLKQDFWKEVAKNPVDKIIPPLASNIFSRTELEKMFRYAYLKFYLRTRYILKRVSKVKNFTDFFRQIKAGFQLLSG
jgi:radical SAM superfamily enzyme YgiQ (UPF0313 family)